MEKIIYNGIELTVGEAYYSTYDLFNEGIGCYVANATDSEGNEYNVYYKITDPDADDEMFMCDWDEIADIELL